MSAEVSAGKLVPAAAVTAGTEPLTALVTSLGVSVARKPKFSPVLVL
jgi:hypothetical protein